MKRSFFSLLLALTLAVGLFLTPAAAAAGSPKLTVSSTAPQTSQTVGFTGLPADCQSLQVTLTLSDDNPTYVFVPDASLDRPGVYTTAQQEGADLTVYVTARSGVLSESGALTLGEVSAGDQTFTVVSAGGLKLVDETMTETPVYDSISVVETSDSSGTSVSRWTVNVTRAANGTLSADMARAKKGETVTVTAVPDSGYVLEQLTVKNASGTELTVRSLGGGKYAFTMPASQVNVSAVFALAGADASMPFADVSADAWYYDAVGYVYEAGLMTGVSADQFAPDMTTTRGMIVTILYRMENSPAVTGGSSFPDVAAGDWYADAVKWASANGIVTGYSDGRFGPTDVITREQMAAILCRYAGYLGRDVSGQADLTGYSDGAQVSSYASAAMGWAVDAGLITGTGAGTLAPAGSATRAQAAVILMRLCQMGE